MFGLSIVKKKGIHLQCLSQSLRRNFIPALNSALAKSFCSLRLPLRKAVKGNAYCPPGTHSLLQTQLGLPPQQRTMSVVKPEGGPAACVKPGQKSCVRSSGIITLLAHGPSDGSGRSRLRRGHNDQSGRGPQCSKTMLTGESWLHISTPRGSNPGPS